MIENVLRNIGGVGLYGVISVCLFFAFFFGAILWAASRKRRYLETMRALPLEDDGAKPSQLEAVSHE